YRGGNGHGGAYNWDLMVNCPSVTDKTDPRYQELTDESIRAMGALLADAGLTNGMHYYSTNYGDASGANVSATRCRDSLGFYGAQTFSASDRTQIRAALDAHRPWAVSISSPNVIFGEEGHSILCDGYGRLDGRWYYHLNMGWNGGSDGWYNFEDYFQAGSLWSNSISCQWGNIYRQKLQTNDIDSGKIIAGRVTDANGNPVAGVKVSISKGGAVWQSMLVWNETVDGSDPYAVRTTALAPDAVGTVFRNYTDENGIWFVDKVAPGDYTVNLEKDGFTFLGDANVTVASKNVWGIGFVAVPDTVGELALESWWMDGGVLYLQFNRAIGDVNVDSSCITVGGKNLNGCVVNSAADSAIVTIDVSSLSLSGSLSMTAGAFYYDVDGSTDEPGTYDVPVIPVAPVVADQAAGSASGETSVVIDITRNGNDFNSDANELVFLVTGSGLDADSINSFKLHVTDSYDGAEGTYARVNASTLPAASIGSWDASSGILTVTIGSGYGFVRVDYVPADGSTPFVAGETYRVNRQGPAIVSATLAKNNAYVDVTFSKPVGGAGTVSALSGVQAIADGQYYRTNTDGAIWSKGVCNTPDATYTGSLDGNAVIGSNNIEDGTAGNALPSVVRVSQAGGLVVVNVGKMMWADMDEDGVFTPGIDGIFLKICDEAKYYREHGEEMSDWEKYDFAMDW
ncbi:MAG: C10 family peptidase, partial [Kiritimatiellae bacterium]|nr:C10 family peptidase [Kiritimatiellia bacterium]